MSNPSPPVTGSSTAIDYQPLSGWAVAGFLMGVLYTITVIGSAILSLVRAEPFFLPGWLYAWAIAAMAFSLIGQSQIRNAEGTRAGAALAKWGLWLSLLTALGYFAYVRFTELALAQQANDFLMTKGPDQGFFPRLKDGSPAETNHAYLLTKTPNIRARIRPEDEQMMARFDVRTKDGAPGELTNFRKTLLVKAMKNGGEKVQVEPMGLTSWQWEKGGYRLERKYRVTTPEMVLDVIVPVQSMTVKAQRKWFVVADQIQVVSEEYTNLGEDQATLRIKALSNFPAYFSNKNSKSASDKPPIEIVGDRSGVDDATVSVVRDALRKALHGERQTVLRGLQPDERQMEPVTKKEGKLQVIVPFSLVALPGNSMIKVEGKLYLQSPEDKAMSPASWRPSRVTLLGLFVGEGSGKR